MSKNSVAFDSAHFSVQRKWQQKKNPRRTIQWPRLWRLRPASECRAFVLVSPIRHCRFKSWTCQYDGVIGKVKGRFGWSPAPMRLANRCIAAAALDNVNVLALAHLPTSDSVNVRLDAASGLGLRSSAQRTKKANACKCKRKKKRERAAPRYTFPMLIASFVSMQV